MSTPKNPDTIIIKNKMYPKGLTQNQVWEYYQKYRGIVLNSTMGRDVMFAIMVDVNKPVMKRQGIQQLTNSNFDTILTGRTSTIYSTMKAYEDFCVVDIDTDDWRKAKHVTQYLYHRLQNFSFITYIKILYTGKNSFHLHCKLKNRMPIDRIRLVMGEYLTNNQDPTIYTIRHKRLPNKPNVDLSPNKFKGAYITEGSLSIWGLRCMEVKLKDLKIFEQWKAKI
jgi:hypothetical protein